MNQVSFNKVRLSLAVLLCLCATSMVNAKVKLPALISDGMVLQREQPIKVWGTADAGEPNQRRRYGFGQDHQVRPVPRNRVRLYSCR